MPSRSLLEAFFEPLLGWSRRFRMSLAFKRASLNGKVSKLSQWFRYSLHIFKRTCLTLLYMKREKNVQVQGLTQKWAWVWVWGRGRGGVELNGECVQKRTFFSINHSKTWEELGRWRPSFFSLSTFSFCTSFQTTFCHIKISFAFLNYYFYNTRRLAQLFFEYLGSFEIFE